MLYLASTLGEFKLVFRQQDRERANLREFRYQMILDRGFRPELRSAFGFGRMGLEPFVERIGG
jgi:hypothetical protein